MIINKAWVVVKYRIDMKWHIIKDTVIQHIGHAHHQPSHVQRKASSVNEGIADFKHASIFSLLAR